MEKLNKTFILLVAFVLSLVACNQHAERLPQAAKNKYSDEKIREIYDLKNVGDTKGLLTFFIHKNEIYQQEAMLAFASLQDTTAVPALLQAIKAENKETREVAAYSLGQIGSPEAVTPLIEQVELETDTGVAIALLEAIGKCATDEGVQFLASFYASKSIDYGVALGLFRASIKGKYSDAGLKRIFELLEPKQSDQTRIIASTYLGRNRDQSLVPHLKALGSLLRNDNNEFVRMNCAAAYRSLAGKADASTLIKAVTLDESDFVKVSAMRALAKMPTKESSKAIAKYLSSTKPNVAVAASAYFTGIESEEAIELALEQLDQVTNVRVRTNLLQAGIASFPKLNQKALDLLKASENRYEKAGLLRALSANPQNYEFIKERLYHSNDAVVKSAAVEGLVAIRSHDDFAELVKTKPDLTSKFADYLKYAIESGDIGMIYHAAVALRNPELNFETAYDSFEFLETAKQKLTLPLDIEAHQELEKTIAFFKGQELSFNNEHKPYPVNWKLLKGLSRNTKLRIKTSKGDIVWQLHVEDAPATVATIVTLAKDGFYNGKTLHRVVPNFVAQGGCPRGDGFGGLSYSIRSEFAQLNYVSGAVGMASAGRDTESCQWFMTHCPTPHLDGRYTIFAQVVEGMDIVQLLEIGDKIISIKIEE